MQQTECPHETARATSVDGECPICSAGNVATEVVNVDASADAPDFTDADVIELEASIARESFLDFVQLGWSLLEPKAERPFTRNYASDAIAEHLQAIGEGRLKRLLIAIPPGSGKSTLASIAFPLWLWTRDPSRRTLHASHGFELARDLSDRARRVVESEWYRSRFGITLRSDQNRAHDFANTASGRRYAVGVGGSLTGVRGDGCAVDDSLNAVDRSSKAIRESVNNWFVDSMLNRLDNPDKAFAVVIQQRLHSDDLIGHLLERGGWEHLCLPAEFDSSRKASTSIGWTDPRTEDGELLSPELLPAAYLEEQKRVLGTAGYSCIFQQSPVDAEGGLFQRQWWRFHKPDGLAPDCSVRPRGCSEAPAIPLPGKFDQTIVSLDAAFKDHDAADNVAFLVIGVRGAQRFVIDRRWGRMSFTKTCATLKELATLYRGATFLVEDAANGTAVVNSLISVVPNLLAVKPIGGKESRASAVSPAVECGQVFLPDGAPWLDDFVSEFEQFPLGKHDDQVDAFSQALGYLTTPDPEFEDKRHTYMRAISCWTKTPRGPQLVAEVEKALAGSEYGPLRPSDIERYDLDGSADKDGAKKSSKWQRELAARFEYRLWRHRMGGF